ncbi:MAG: ArsR/SmtB family transcription factor [Candidatus Binatia bacterium]
MSNPSGDTFERAARVLKALSHRLRLELVCGLRHHPCTQTFIAAKLGLPQSTIAQHLKVLRSQGLVREERRGVEVVFSLADPALAHMIDTLCEKGDVALPRCHSWDEIASVERASRAPGHP